MKASLIVAAYNRPEYLQKCLFSISVADLSALNTILIIDDCSSSEETKTLINDFKYPGVEVIKVFSKENRSIKGSLLAACDLLYDTTDIFINLDGDAIVRKDFVSVLLDLHETFPDHIKTGFNCLTKNKNGTERHKVLTTGINHNTKASVGGLNMCFSKRNYDEWIRPALIECLATQGNWDHKACLRSGAAGFSIICAVPSVCDHIGFDSAMGHSKGGEPPDVAADFVYEMENKVIYDDGLWMAEGMKEKIDKFNEAYKVIHGGAPVEKYIDLREVRKIAERNDETVQAAIDRIVSKKLFLPNVTLVSVDCVNLERVFKASDKCTEHIQFADVKIFTSLTTEEKKCENIISIEPITSKESYSWFVMKQLAQHIDTSHLLIFQHDGYVLNPSAWKDEWLEYDYIGAPWEWYPDNRVGNGGFSLRSKKLMDAVANDPKLIPTTDGVNTHKEEDHCLARIYRKYLEDNYNIKFAPLEVARQFSIEGWRSPNKTWTNEFGFHGNGLTNIKP